MSPSVSLSCQLGFPAFTPDPVHSALSLRPATRPGSSPTSTNLVDPYQLCSAFCPSVLSHTSMLKLQVMLSSRGSSRCLVCPHSLPGFLSACASSFVFLLNLLTSLLITLFLYSIRFRRAWQVQGHSVEELPFQALGGVYGSWFGVILIVLVLIAQFYIVSNSSA